MRNEGIMTSSHQKLLPLILLLLLASTAAAQTYRAALRGTVYDPNEAVIPSASIKIVNVATNESRSTVSNDEGTYAIASLAAGKYRLEVDAPGFARLEITAIELQVNQDLRLDSHL